MTAAAITLVTVARRVYLRGNTYPIKGQIRDLGGHWDADEGAWWVGAGKRAAVEKLVGKAVAKAQAREAALPPATGEMVAVAGNTYSVRDQLRELGGRWDGARKAWMVPASRAEQARKLVGGAPKKERAPRPNLSRVGEKSDIVGQFEGIKQDRTPDYKVGESCWLRHRGQRIAAVVVGYEPATYVSSDLAEDMGHYGMSSGYYGSVYYRVATQDEFAALQALSPREDGVCAS